MQTYKIQDANIELKLQKLDAKNLLNEKLV